MLWFHGSDSDLCPQEGGTQLRGGARPWEGSRVGHVRPAAPVPPQGWWVQILWGTLPPQVRPRDTVAVMGRGCQASLSHRMAVEVPSGGPPAQGFRPRQAALRPAQPLLYSLDARPDLSLTPFLGPRCWAPGLVPLTRDTPNVCTLPASLGNSPRAPERLHPRAVPGQGASRGHTGHHHLWGRHR